MKWQRLRRQDLGRWPLKEIVLAHPVVDLFPNLPNDGGIIVVHQDAVDGIGDAFHILGHQPTGRNGSCPEAHSRCGEGRFVIEGNHVLVDRDVGLDQGVFGEFSGESFGSQVNQDEVIVCSARNDLIAAFEESLCQGLGVLAHLCYVVLEVVGESLPEGDSLGGDDMLEWPALCPREYAAIE